MDDAAVSAAVRTVVATEAATLAGLADHLAGQTAALATACRLIHDGGGRLVATGVGKAGLIARKVAATFASTGTPALFLHPTEARHGDLGMVQAQDVVLAFSNSGASDELVALLPSLAHIGARLIAVTGDPASPLARHATVAIDLGRITEACPLGLAPSASTTAMLALGDALALAVQRRRAFTPEQYARFHPGGALGRRLMTCAEAMRGAERTPAVTPDTPVIACMRAITAARAGAVVLIDAGRQVLGIFTDGDLRRCLARAADPAAVLSGAVSAHATMPCRTIAADALVEAALRRCAEKKINELPVVDAAGALVGLIDVQDLVDRGFATPLAPSAPNAAG